MMTIYYESGLPARLIPVQFIGWAKSPMHDVTGCVNAVVRVKRELLPYYPRGEVLHVPARCVVEKAGRRDYHQLVRPAQLPPVDRNDLMEARV
jgi:hypothetical protein